MGTPMILRRRDAKAAGLKRYFSGVSCKNGHIAERYVSGDQCCECTNAAFRTYRENNIAREKTRRRGYYETHKNIELPRAIAYQVALRANGLDYYTKNANELRERARLKRLLDPTAARLNDRKLRTLYKETLNAVKRAWEKRHPEVRKQKRRNRRAKERGASGKHTAAEIKALYTKQVGKCAFCFKKLNGRYEVDHYIALAKGGSNDVGNLQILCRPCNQKKHATDPILFAQRHGKLF